MEKRATRKDCEPRNLLELQDKAESKREKRPVMLQGKKGKHDLTAIQSHAVSHLLEVYHKLERRVRGRPTMPKRFYWRGRKPGGNEENGRPSVSG